MNEDKLLQQAKSSLQFIHTQPAMQHKLRESGYTHKQLKEGMELCNQLELLQKHTKNALNLSRETNGMLRVTRREIHNRYMHHLSLARIAFQFMPEYQARLGLKGARQKKLEHWLIQLQDFYVHALTVADFLERYSIPKNELHEAQSQLAQMKDMQLLQQQADTQWALLSQQKEATVAILEEWLLQFRKAAQLTFADEPRQLSDLGLIEKSKMRA